MSQDDKGQKVHLYGELYRVKMSLLKPANRSLDAASGEIVFSNPRKLYIGSKPEPAGMSMEEMDSLGDAILQDSMLQALVVRPMKDGTFEIVDGERRWRRLKKAIAEKRTCRNPSDGQIVPAEQAYDMVECRIREMTDLEAYQLAAKSPGVPPSFGATASLAKYLHDHEVSDDEILAAVNHKSHKWLQETLKIMSMDDFCVQSFLRRDISHNVALQYANQKDVAARVARCKEDVSRVQSEYAEMMRDANQRVNTAVDNCERSKADKVIAEYNGVGVEELDAETQKAETEVTKRRKEADKLKNTQPQVTGRNIKSPRVATDPTTKFITKRTMEQDWIIPLEQLVHCGGIDKGGEDMGVNMDEVRCLLWAWNLMCKGERDILGQLRKRQAKQLTAV